MSNDTITQVPTADAATAPPSPVGDLPDRDAPYVLQRDEGVHGHFLNQLATTKVSPGDTGSLTAVEFHAPRGFGPPLHRHEDEDEIIIVLEGRVAFRSGDVETIGESGATAWLPHGVPHTFQVLSDTARMATISASRAQTPRFDRMVAALSDPAAEPAIPVPGEIDPGEVARVCADHGIEILGPPPAPLSD